MEINPVTKEERKVVVVKKKVDKKQPRNFIDMLIQKKQSMYQMEEYIKGFKEQDLKQEEDSSDDEEEEDFSWWHHDSDHTYYAMTTKYKANYKAGEQVFNCYGRRTNRFLLLNYGFVLRNNKYNSFSFRVWLNFPDEKKNKEERKKALKNSDEEEEEEEEDERPNQLMRLKNTRLCDELFAYLRANLLNKYQGSNHQKLIISAPVDLDFELFAIACTCNLLKNLQKNRSHTPLEEDRLEQQKAGISMRKQFALTYRIAQKEILHNNIRYCEILLRILARIKEGMPFKKAFLNRVDDFEIKEEVLHNRLIMRKYFRELTRNHEKLLNKKLC